MDSWLCVRPSMHCPVERLEFWPTCMPSSSAFVWTRNAWILRCLTWVWTPAIASWMSSKFTVSRAKTLFFSSTTAVLSKLQWKTFLELRWCLNRASVCLRLLRPQSCWNRWRSWSCWIWSWDVRNNCLAIVLHQSNVCRRRSAKSIRFVSLFPFIFIGWLH